MNVNAQNDQPTEFTSTENYDVIIVGGGLVGAALACLISEQESLADTPMRIALIEANPSAPIYHPDKFDPRVVALSLRSQEILQRTQVWQSVCDQRACFYTKMHVWDAEGTGEVTFNCADVHEDQLGAIVENGLVLSLLYQRLEKLSTVDVYHGVSVERFECNDGRSRIYLSDGMSLDAELVVGADGARSNLRALCGIETREWDYGHSSIVATVTTERSHQSTAWQRFLPEGPLAFLPLFNHTLQRGDANDHDQQSSIVWSTKHEDAKALMALSDNAFCECLGNAFEFKLGRIEQVDKRHCFPLRQRHAKTYFKSGLALVGDAAHTIHPLAGQGVNLGFYDIDVLVEEIVRAKSRGIALGHTSVLSRYQRNRQTHNLSAMVAMESLKRLFAADHLGVRWIRNIGMHWVNQNMLIKKQLAHIARGA